jgi:hypothetical protein
MKKTFSKNLKKMNFFNFRHVSFLMNTENGFDADSFYQQQNPFAYLQDNFQISTKIFFMPLDARYPSEAELAFLNKQTSCQVEFVTFYLKSAATKSEDLLLRKMNCMKIGDNWDNWEEDLIWSVKNMEDIFMPKENVFFANTLRPVIIFPFNKISDSNRRGRRVTMAKIFQK